MKCNHGNHNHDHGDHGHDHGDHGSCRSELGESYSLYRHINLDSIVCYNELEDKSAMRIFKPLDKKMDKDNYLMSDVDEQLIIYVAFTGSIKLKSFVLIGGPDGSSPKNVSIFTNREDINFENVDSLKPTQSWVLCENDFDGLIEYTTNVSKFSSLSSITIYISSNYGAERSRIYYIGLSGVGTRAIKEAVRVTYELVPSAEESVKDRITSHEFV